VILRLRGVSRLAFPSALLCAVGLLVAGCGGGAHSNALEPSASVRSSSAGVATTPTSHPTAHPTAKAHEMRGTNGNDRLIGTSGGDIINGLRGSDIIRGGAGDDVLRDYTGVGRGVAVPDATSDAFYGGPGDDVIYASQHDHVYAGPGDDTIYADYLFQPGQVIHCGPGRDVVIENDDYPSVVLRGCEKLRVEYAG
jgi:hypothetical protein